MKEEKPLPIGTLIQANPLGFEMTGIIVVVKEDEWGLSYKVLLSDGQLMWAEHDGIGDYFQVVRRPGGDTLEP